MTEWMPFLAHAGLTIGLFVWLHSDINLLRQETNARFDAARKETNERFTELHKDIQAVDIRLARVEATIETTFRLQGALPADHQERVV